MAGAATGALAGCRGPLQDHGRGEDRDAAQDLDRRERLAEQDGGQRHPDDRLEQHQDPGPRPADEPDPGQEHGRGDGGGEQPGEHEQRQDGRVADRVAERGAVARQQPDDQAAADGRGQHHGHRLVGRDLPVAGPADHHEHGLAQRRPERQPEPDGIEPDPGRRVELRGDDGDHPGHRQPEGDHPRPVERLAPDATLTSATITGYV